MEARKVRDPDSYNTAAAIEATQNYAAQRAATVPAKREKAVRIVAAGLVGGSLTVEQILEAARKMGRALTAT